MDPTRIWFALVGLLGFVAIWPVWNFFIGAYAAPLPDYEYFLVNLVPPAAVALFIASWVQPGGV